MFLTKFFAESYFFGISINTYDDDRFTRLKSPRNDLEGVCKQLERPCNGFKSILLDEIKANSDGIKVFLEEMITTVNTISGRSGENTNRVVFYFAGHGKAFENNNGSATGYIIPKDGIVDDVKTWISMDCLVEYIYKIQAKHVLIVLDCCFAGSLEWASFNTREVATVPKQVYKQHLRLYARDKAWQAITSSTFDQAAVDHGCRNNDEKLHSPFAKAFIAALDGEADLLKNGLITASELAVYLRNKVERLAWEENIHHRPQTPRLVTLKHHNKGEFLFLNPHRTLDLPDAVEANRENNPFKGLMPYEQSDQNKFYGRDRVISEIVDIIQNRIEEIDTANFLVVTGASGSGKSSVIKAGVVPALMEKGWNIAAIIRPGEKPVESLRNISLQEADKKNLIVIDQLEELITLGKNKQETEKFIDELHKLFLTNKKCFVIATLASDFQHLVTKGKFENVWQSYRYRIPWFNRQELHDIILRPAVDIAFTYEPVNLVDTIIDDVLQYPGSLPMLSVLLSVLYEKSIENNRNRYLHQEDYDTNIGGVSGALHIKLNTLLGEANENEAILKIILLRMINNEGGAYTKRQVNKTDLVFDNEELNIRILDQINMLIKERIIHSFYGKEGCWEPVHDAVVRWDKLKTWVEEIGMPRLGLQKELENDIDIYKKNGNKKNDLWHNNERLSGLVSELKEKKKRENNLQWLINKNERSFVELSEKVRSNRKKRSVFFLGFVIAILAAIAIVAIINAKEANHQRSIAEDELVRFYGNLSKTAISENNFSEALLFAAEAIGLRKDADLIRNLLINNDLVERTPNLMRIFSHQDTVNSAVFSPDGKSIVTASQDKTVRLWDVGTGKQIGLPIQHDSAAYRAIFSPDGTRILTTSGDGKVRLWQVETGRQIGPSMGDSLTIHRAVFSPDGKRILTANVEGMVRVWEAGTGQQIGPSMQHKSFVYRVVFSPDGNQILTANNDGTAGLWLAATGKQVGPFMQHESFVTCAVFSPDGKQILTASNDKTARLWDAGTGKQIGPSMQHGALVRTAVFSPDGKRILTATDDRIARLWEAGTGKQIGPAMQYNGAIRAAVFSPNGKWILTAFGDKTARLWDVSTGRQVGPCMQHESLITGAVFSPDGKQILTASYDKTARLWEIRTGSQDGPSLEHESSIISAVFSRDGKQILTASADNTARLWEKTTGRQIGPSLQHESSVNSAIFSPDEKQILTASGDKTARLWEAGTGKQIGFSMKHGSSVKSAVFSPDGKRILTASWDKTARLWEAGTNKQIGPPMQHGSSVNSAIFSPDGKQILTTSWDNNTQLWDVATGKKIGPSMHHESMVRTAVFSPDGKRILTASLDKTSRLWEAGTGKQIGPSMQHEYWVNSAVFSPDGSRILTASADGTARLWDAVTGMQVGPSIQHKTSITNAIFSPDGKLILTLCWDSTARVWEAGTDRQVGPSIQSGSLINSAVFSPDGKSILMTTWNSTARLWNLWEDMDIPGDLFKLQAMKITGCRLRSGSNQIEVIPAPEWHKLEDEYNDKARKHYQICRYPEYNLWRRFIPEEERKSVKIAGKMIGFQ